MTDPQRFQRFRNGSRVMSEIINHRHAALLATNFKSTFYSLKSIESQLDLRVAQPAMSCAESHHQRVANIQLSYHRDLKFGFSDTE